MLKEELRIIFQKLPFVLLLLIANNAIFSQWNLDSCLYYGLNNNLTIQYTRNLVSKQETIYKQAKYQALPYIYGQAGHSLSSGRSLNLESYTWETSEKQQGEFGISGELIVFNGLYNYYNSKFQNNSFKSEEMNLQDEKYNLILEITKVYYDIIFSYKQKQLITLQLERTIEEIKYTNELISSGLRPESSIYDLLAQKGKEVLKIEDYNLLMEEGYLELKRLLNLDPSGEIEISLELDSIIILDSININQLIEDNIRKHPKIESALYKVEANKNLLKRYKASIYPELVLTSSMSSRYINNAINPLDPNPSDPSWDYSFKDQIFDNQYGQLALNLNIPIFNKLNNKTNIQISRIELENSKIEYRETVNLIVSELTTYTSRFEAFNKKKQISEKNIIAYKNAYEVAYEKYKAGIITSFELNESNNNYTQALLEYEKVRFSLMLNYSILNVYAGNTIYLN